MLRTRDCYSPEYKRKKCAEFLVPDHVPPELIIAIHTINDSAASRVREALIEFSSHDERFRPMIDRVTPNAALYY